MFLSIFYKKKNNKKTLIKKKKKKKITVVNLVAWTLNQSEARFDLLLIETSLLLFFLKLVPTK